MAATRSRRVPVVVIVRGLCGVGFVFIAYNPSCARDVLPGFPFDYLCHREFRLRAITPTCAGEICRPRPPPREHPRTNGGRPDGRTKTRENSRLTGRSAPDPIAFLRRWCCDHPCVKMPKSSPVACL